jgi:hypothetical protein
VSAAAVFTQLGAALLSPATLHYVRPDRCAEGIEGNDADPCSSYVGHEGTVMEETCAVVHQEGQLLIVSFFNVVLLIDDAEGMIRQSQPELHLIAKNEGDGISVFVVGPNEESKLPPRTTRQ